MSNFILKHLNISDSNSRDPPISSTDKVVPIMVPVTDTSIVASVGSLLT